MLFLVISSGKSGNQTERRLEARVPAAGSGRLTVLQTGESATREATIVDVSRSGLQIEVDQPVECGARVEIELRGLLIFGAARNCRPHGGGFRVGVATGGMMEIEPR